MKQITLIKTFILLSYPCNSMGSEEVLKLQVKGSIEAPITWLGGNDLSSNHETLDFDFENSGTESNTGIFDVGTNMLSGLFGGGEETIIEGKEQENNKQADNKSPELNPENKQLDNKTVNAKQLSNKTTPQINNTSPITSKSDSQKVVIQPKKALDSAERTIKITSTGQFPTNVKIDLPKDCTVGQDIVNNSHVMFVSNSRVVDNDLNMSVGPSGEHRFKIRFSADGDYGNKPGPIKCESKGSMNYSY